MQKCDLTDDWQVRQQRVLPPEVWQFLKKERFFGMIIPKEYDGLGFSPSANSAVVAKLSSASVTLAVTVMVPNSLGPAELLIHYGTETQKSHYLPRLARGQEIPAFALTEPGARSDADDFSSAPGMAAAMARECSGGKMRSSSPPITTVRAMMRGRSSRRSSVSSSRSSAALPATSSRAIPR